jgi:hypothetical protein
MCNVLNACADSSDRCGLISWRPPEWPRYSRSAAVRVANASTGFHPKRQRKLPAARSIFLRFGSLRNPLTRAAPVRERPRRGPIPEASNQNKEDTMPLFRFAKKYFRPFRFSADHRPVWRFWVWNGDQAALINPASGRVHAYIWHDGCRKYYPTIILPVWRALPLILRREGWVISLLPFPRIGLDFFRVKAGSIAVAKQFVEYVLDTGGTN